MTVREIKFRVYDPNTGYMHFAGLDKISFYDFDGDNITEQDGLEIMQYTGMKDRNGVEIYEGDIMMWEKISNVKTVVTFSKGQFWNGDMPLMDCVDEEVIGNIYEHPHLLAKEEEPT